MSRSERVWGTWKSVCPCVIYLKIRTLWVWEVVFKEYEKCFVLEMEMFKTRLGGGEPRSQDGKNFRHFESNAV